MTIREIEADELRNVTGGASAPAPVVPIAPAVKMPDMGGKYTAHWWSLYRAAGLDK